MSKTVRQGEQNRAISAPCTCATASATSKSFSDRSCGNRQSKPASKVLVDAGFLACFKSVKVRYARLQYTQLSFVLSEERKLICNAKVIQFIVYKFPVRQERGTGTRDGNRWVANKRERGGYRSLDRLIDSGDATQTVWGR